MKQEIEDADMRHDDVFVAILPKQQFCDLCGKTVKYVYQTWDRVNEDGSLMQLCSSCRELYKKLEKLPENVMQGLLAKVKT